MNNNDDMKYLIEEKRRNTTRIKDMLEIMARIGINIKEVLGEIIDEDQDQSLVNTAKYCNYWLEKSEYIDEPPSSKYNDYKD